MKLKLYRNKAGMTQEEVANALGIPKKTYQNYEYGVRDADSDILCALADLYGISLDDLVGRQIALREDEIAARETDELVTAFQALDQKGRAVLLDVASSLREHFGNEQG